MRKLSKTLLLLLAAMMLSLSGCAQMLPLQGAEPPADLMKVPDSRALQIQLQPLLDGLETALDA